CRAMIGDTLADGLAIPKTRWSRAIAPVRTVVQGLETIRRSVPGLDDWVVRKGLDYWDYIIALGSEGKPALFEPPERLWGGARTA
ncbi:MAG: hypothetical protein AAFS10_18515, partial [Myxococcota bacterium]